MKKKFEHFFYTTNSGFFFGSIIVGALLTLFYYIFFSKIDFSFFIAFILGYIAAAYNTLYFKFQKKYLKENN